MKRSILIPIVLVVLVIILFAVMFMRPNVSGPAPGVSVSDPATPAGS